MVEELCYHLLDLIQNSVRANAKNIRVLVEKSKKRNILKLRVEDDGKGMDEATLLKAQDPFYSTKNNRKTGLGIPLLKEMAELCSGKFRIESQLGKGTSVEATFQLNHIDRPPLGDIAKTIFILIPTIGNSNLEITLRTDKGEIKFSTKEIREYIGEDIPLTHPEIISFLRAYIYDNVKKLELED